MKQHKSPFKWRHFEPTVMLLYVRWYYRYSLSYRDVQYSTKFWELMKGSDLPFAPVDIPVQAAFADYAQGRDTVLQAALGYKAK